MTFITNSGLDRNAESLTPYSLRPATLDDSYEIWKIMDACFQALEHKEYFICDDLDYVKDILSGHGFGIVACDMEGNIIGNLLVKYPGLEEENLGYDVFISPKEPVKAATGSHGNKINASDILLTPHNLNRVLHMDSASVHPNHRGHGLESRMITYAESLVDTSKYCYSFATVSPKNLASLKSLERNGYQVMVIKEKYEGFLRCIMMKKL